MNKEADEAIEKIKLSLDSLQSIAETVSIRLNTNLIDDMRFMIYELEQQMKG